MIIAGWVDASRDPRLTEWAEPAWLMGTESLAPIVWATGSWEIVGIKEPL
jgi:hypothetical protein